MRVTFHVIAYTTRDSAGVATITSSRNRPSRRDCARQIPGFISGAYLGSAPAYKLHYTLGGKSLERQLDTRRVEILGRFLMRLADRGRVTGIAVTDHNGGDLTFNFPCFRA